jgi:DNA helicase IV
VDQKSTELAEEQEYFDRADKNRQRHQAHLDDLPEAAANAGAAQRFLKWVKGRRDARATVREAVAFGRIDDGSEEPLYIGNELITDEEHDILVINWRTKAAEPFYKATAADPHGLVRKRSFVCDGNLVTDFADVHFRQLAEDIQALDGPDGLLLAELDRARDGTMHEIVATIQAAQYDLIRSPVDRTLVIEGGPGTGKTAVALHRVSWLLYNHRDKFGAAEIVVVGPNPAFTRYVRTVLPELGDAEVEHTDIGRFAPAVLRGRPEPLEVRRLKGDGRMAGLLARALEARVGTPDPAERMLFEGRFVTIPGAEVQAVLDECRAAPGGYAQRRALLRARLHDLARERGAPTERERLEPVDNLVERLWPQFSAPAFLRQLLGSKRRLAAAAGPDLTAEEAMSLQRQAADKLSTQTWSEADLPLLDEVEDLINGVPRRYRHMVVDEAQDLSPMQLRSVARRSASGSFTLVGDLAQSTGAWARDDWADLLRHLPDALPSSVSALRYGYRVPRQVYELAARLLPLAAPGLAPLTVVRDGPAEPGIHRVEASERPGRTVAIAMEHAAEGRFVGIVCPPARRQELVDALAANQVEWSGADQGEVAALVNVVGPHEAKGLEFDAVVVVEPEDIVAGDERGHRLLFIALTRTTRYLDIVAAGDPLPMAAPVRVPQQRAESLFEPDERGIEGLAEQVAAMVAGSAPAAAWYEVLNRAAAILDRQSESAPRRGVSGRHRRG